MPIKKKHKRNSRRKEWHTLNSNCSPVRNSGSHKIENRTERKSNQEKVWAHSACKLWQAAPSEWKALRQDKNCVRHGENWSCSSFCQLSKETRDCAFIDKLTGSEFVPAAIPLCQLTKIIHFIFSRSGEGKSVGLIYTNGIYQKCFSHINWQVQKLFYVHCGEKIFEKTHWRTQF